ncbi:hypothetical protein ACEWPM_010680 [Roseovarius sp. S4756]|uniref:hypothetical protein n=1 Tax=Roseovarius maritimus TaxID=3342637 RepID=UPI00372B39B3
MRLVTILAAVTALSACGVDGAPIRPGSQDELAPARNQTPVTSGPIGGTSSVHAGAVL